MVLESVLVSFFYKWLTRFPSTYILLFKKLQWTLFILLLLLFWLCCAACEILIPQPGVETQAFGMEF